MNFKVPSLEDFQISLKIISAQKMGKRYLFFVSLDFQTLPQSNWIFVEITNPLNLNLTLPMIL